MISNPHTWWYVARASGVTAWVLATAAVLWGLALSSRALGPRPRAPWLLDLHRFIGGLSVVFVGVHIGGLMADTYVHFGVADIAIPFHSHWRPTAVAWGVVAAYLLIAVEITSLLMRRLPKKLWHVIHLSSLGLYVMGTIHLLTAGTDAHSPWLLTAAIASIAAVTFLLSYRVMVPRQRASRASRIPASLSSR